MIKKIFTSKPAEIFYAFCGAVWTSVCIVTAIKKNHENRSEEL
jgi:hypothetical protein